MKRTAIYMRVSSDRQAREGDSIPAQREALRKYIDGRDNLVFAGEYLDDGISGTKEDRDELQRLLADVKAGKIDLVLVTKLDRLYRSIRHYLNLQETLDKYGVGWTAIWEPVYDTTTPQGRLIINQMMIIAQFEAENTGQRIRQVFDYKVSQGEVIFGKKSPGLMVKDKHLVASDLAPCVREVFEFYDRNGSVNATTRSFMGVDGLPSSKQGFKKLLTNRLYIGEYRDNHNYCEPIIDRRLWDSVQRKLSMNIKSSQKHEYIFSGLIRCPVCGYIMSSGMINQKRKSGQYIRQRYRCDKYYNIKACTNTKVIMEITLEKQLLERLRPDLEGMVLKAKAESRPQKDNRDRIAALERKLSRLKDLYVNDLITLDEFKSDKESLQAEIAVLASQKPQEAVDLAEINKLLSQPFETLYGGFTQSQKRFFWRSIIKEIRIDQTRFEVDYL